MIQNIVINGLINGSIYALLAIGFSLVFGVARIVNIAHTAFYMLAAYFIYVGFSTWGFPLMWPCPFPLLLWGSWAWSVTNLFINPIREHEAAVLIATIALAMVIQEALLIGFGGHYLGVPPWSLGMPPSPGVKVTYQHLLALGVAVLALFGTWALMMKTVWGWRFGPRPRTGKWPTSWE
jgi:branched-chain amino acid transport system permease protein